MNLTRRAHLQGHSALPLTNFAAETRAPKVTITGLETFRVRVDKRGDWLIARLQTSAGVTELATLRSREIRF